MRDFAAIDELAADEPAGGEVREYLLGVAQSIWPKGTTFYCPRCEQARTATPGQIATYFERGMPTCHGQPMRIGEPVLN